MLKFALGIFSMMVLAEVYGHDRSKGEQCVATLQAPEGSAWKTLGLKQSKVSLHQVEQLSDTYGLTLVEGSPPPSAPQAVVLVKCERLGDMWAGLPDPSVSLDDENNSPLVCRLEKMKDSMSSFLGMKSDAPKQYPGQPRRVYMKNYCGVTFPVTTKSDVAKRMHENTRKLEKKLNSWRE